MAAPTDVSASRVGSLGGRVAWRASGSDTNIGNGDEEVAIDGLPVYGTILALRVVLTAGTGTTVDPEVYRETGGGDLDTIAVNDTAAASIDDQSKVRYYADDGVLYLSYGINDATADHSVEWELYVVDGWV